MRTEAQKTCLLTPPNDLRNGVEQAIFGLIEPVAWQRCEVVNKAERESLQTVLEQWGVAP